MTEEGRLATLEHKTDELARRVARLEAIERPAARAARVASAGWMPSPATAAPGSPQRAVAAAAPAPAAAAAPAPPPRQRLEPRPEAAPDPSARDRGAREPAPAPRPRRSGADIEDLVGGRVLAWLGGIAVLLGISFLVAVGISRGVIGEEARTLLAAAGSLALLLAGMRLHGRRGRTDASLALVATGIAGLFVTDAVAAQVYDLIPPVAGMLLAFAPGAVATALAIRWDARGIAALGIVGALLAPVLAGAPAEGGTVALLLPAAASAVGVLVWRRWDWLALAAFAIATPQWAVYVLDAGDAVALLATLVAFGTLGAAAAVGYELRVPAAGLRPSSSFLLALNALALALVGWPALESAAGEAAADLWLAGLAVVHLAVGLAARRSGRIADEVALLAAAIGVVLADAAFAAIADGPVLALGWAASAAGLAALARRVRGTSHDELTLLAGVGGHTALALVHAVGFEAPPSLIAGGGLSAGGALAVAAVAAGCLVSGRLAAGGRHGVRVLLDATGLALAAYLAAIALDGPALALAWSLEAVALAAIARRHGDRVAAVAALLHVAAATGHALAIDAPPALLASGTASLGGAGALAAALAACVACARMTAPEARDLRGSLDAAAVAIAAYLAAVALDGPAVALAWAAGAAALAELGRHARAELAPYGSVALLAGAVAHAFALEAPPGALLAGLDAPLDAVVALAACAAAALWLSRLDAGDPRWRPAMLVLAGVALLHLASTLVVTPFGPADAAAGSLLEHGATQRGQALLSALWAATGVAALVAGLRRDRRPLRLAALALLGATVAKVFLFDLAALTSLYRVASFVALGLLLLLAAFVWQRLRPRPLPDLRETPAALR